MCQQITRIIKFGTNGEYSGMSVDNCSILLSIDLIKIRLVLRRLENYFLTVTLVKEEDGGEYEVRADNEMGSVSSKSTVTVHSEYLAYRLYMT